MCGVTSGHLRTRPRFHEKYVANDSRLEFVSLHLAFTKLEMALDFDFVSLHLSASVSILA